MKQFIFLSHIHEEKDLAKIIQTAIQNEFSGFVNVFVSSDGITIPSGTNFLTRIEDGLVNCVGGIYLISPKSVKRNWINFELGALWIRNVIHTKKGEQEIPTIPFCHSGSSPGSLPMPLTNLSAIDATDINHLKDAFRSIQKAVGGSGELKTDFISLSKEIIAFQNEYTIVDNFLNLIRIINPKKEEISDLLRTCKSMGPNERISLNLGDIDSEVANKIKKLTSNSLSQLTDLNLGQRSLSITDEGPMNAVKTNLSIQTDLFIDYEDKILKEFF